MIILLSKKEKNYFDMLADDMNVLDALNIMSQISLKCESIKIELDDKPEDEDDEDDGPESGVLPKDMKIKPEPTNMKPIPAYDSRIVLESRISGYT